MIHSIVEGRKSLGKVKLEEPQRQKLDSLKRRQQAQRAKLSSDRFRKKEPLKQSWAHHQWGGEEGGGRYP